VLSLDTPSPAPTQYRQRARRLAEALLRDRAERNARKAERAGKTVRAERAEFDPFQVVRRRVVAGRNPGYVVATPMKQVPTHKCEDHEYRGGFRIDCHGCGKSFESLGWAHCSNACKRASRERRANVADMAEVGIEPQTRHKCQECGGNIPRWRNGRQVSKATRFCSDRCARKAKRAIQNARGPDTGPPSFVRPNDKKVAVNGPLLIGPQTIPPVLRNLREWLDAGCPVTVRGRS
jgi:hypothetical protein